MLVSGRGYDFARVLEWFRYGLVKSLCMWKGVAVKTHLKVSGELCSRLLLILQRAGWSKNLTWEYMGYIMVWIYPQDSSGIRDSLGWDWLLKMVKKSWWWRAIASWVVFPSTSEVQGERNMWKRWLLICKYGQAMLWGCWWIPVFLSYVKNLWGVLFCIVKVGIMAKHHRSFFLHQANTPFAQSARRNRQLGRSYSWFFSCLILWLGG